MTTPKTYYGIVNGEWHAVRLRGGGESMFATICEKQIIPISVMSYLGGELCPECREVITRRIVEEE